mmetsp:Transcript_39229/g.54469  ORF Transcript_39229/g.54469 Transcript_39229/m.54469 type:complete len:391 (-) Transcript_39229:240-1412(-)
MDGVKSTTDVDADIDWYHVVEQVAPGTQVWKLIVGALTYAKGTRPAEEVRVAIQRLVRELSTSLPAPIPVVEKMVESRAVRNADGSARVRLKSKLVRLQNTLSSAVADGNQESILQVLGDISRLPSLPAALLTEVPLGLDLKALKQHHRSSIRVEASAVIQKIKDELLVESSAAEDSDSSDTSEQAMRDKDKSLVLAPLFDTQRASCPAGPPVKTDFQTIFKAQLDRPISAAPRPSDRKHFSNPTAVNGRYYTPVAKASEGEKPRSSGYLSFESTRKKGDSTCRKRTSICMSKFGPPDAHPKLEGEYGDDGYTNANEGLKNSSYYATKLPANATNSKDMERVTANLRANYDKEAQAKSSRVVQVLGLKEAIRNKNNRKKTPLISRGRYNS